MEAIRAVENGVEESDDNRIDRGFQILTNLIDENMFLLYPFGSVRRLIDILYHPILQSKTRKLNSLLSSVVDYFVALYFKQALEVKIWDVSTL